MKVFGSRVNDLRLKANLSQTEVANQINLSRATYAKLESGEKSPTLEQLLRLSEIFKISTDQLLANQPINNKSISKIKFQTSPKATAPQINKQTTVDTLREVLLYVLNKVGAKPNIGQTALYKLLYFIDFDYYEKNCRSVTGLTYIKNHYGPTPQQTFQDVINKMKSNKELEEVKVKYFAKEQVKYLPVIKPSFNHINADELKHIDSVLQRLGEKNASQLSALSHQDMPWLATDENQVIDYQLVMYRTAVTSIKIPEDEL